MYFFCWKVLYDLVVKYYCILIIVVLVGELNVFYKMWYWVRLKYGVFGCCCFEILNLNVKIIDYVIIFRCLEVMVLC